MLIPQPQPTTPPTELQTAFTNLLRNNNDIYLTVKSLSQLNYDIIWNGKGYTANDIFALLGTDAVKMFEGAAAVQALIQTIDPTFAMPPAPCPVTVNADGTVVATLPTN